jgi:Uma2 family endonuclease
MATLQTTQMTADEFWEWIHQPQNGGKHWELERGVAVEMPPPGELHGAVALLVGHLLAGYTFARKQGYVCVNDAGLLVEQGPDTVRGPDLMLFDEKRRLDDLNRKFSRGVPKLVVEVLSPNDRPGKLGRRINQYLRRGIPLVWVVDCEDRFVTVYQPDREHRSYDETEEVTGEDVLPNLRFRVADFFTLPGEAE